MQFSSLLPKLGRAGSIAAAVLTFLTIAWVILLVYPSAPASDASPYERLQFIADHQHWQTASFVVAALMAGFYLPVWAALAGLIMPVRQTLGLIVGVLGVLFSALFVVGYLTQFTTVRSLDELRQSNAEAAVAVAEAFDFSGNFWSASYGIVIAAFVLWGMTTLTIFAGLIDSPSKQVRRTAAFYGVAGTFAIVGAIGFGAGISFLEHGILISGIVFIPALLSTVVLLNEVAVGGKAHPQRHVSQWPPTEPAAHSFQRSAAPPGIDE